MTDSPYKGLVPFAEEDARFFFGRDDDRRIIAANVYAARLTVLYGASGVGKSSVLQAGVAHDLHQQPGRAVVVFRDWHTEPLAALKQALAEEIREVLQKVDVDRNLPLDAFLGKCAEGVRPPLVIVLDQFEEYFLYHAEEDRPHSFAAEFARAVNAGNRRVSFLVSLREDALSGLDRFQRRIPGLFNNYLRLEPLKGEAARQAVTRPLEVYSQGLPPEERIEAEPGLVEAVIEQVKVGQVMFGQEGRGQVALRGAAPREAGETAVEAPYLQLVMARLWEEERKRNSRILRLATLTSLGGVDKIVRTHLDGVMKRLRPEQEEIAARIFNFLVTPSGMKIAHRPADLAEYSEVHPDRVQTVVRRLAEPDVRVLRPLAPASVGEGETSYEIYHNSLAQAVLDWRARYLRRASFLQRVTTPAIFLVLAFILLDFSSTLLPETGSILFALRALFLVILNAGTMLLAYRGFYPGIRLQVTRLPLPGLGGPNVGILLGLLLMGLWYFSFRWPTGLSDSNALGEITREQYLKYLVTLMLTWVFGTITFVVMRAVGQATRRASRNFDLGFYGVYFGVCALIAVLTLLAVLQVLPDFISF